MSLFPEVKKNFGFGCMRLPLKDGQVDAEVFSQMIDYFLDNGFNYFDTAIFYSDSKSEAALGKCLSARHPRESFVLTDKLTNGYFNSREDIRPLFEGQLQRCGVDYFDFYLMHAQSRGRYLKYEKLGAYDEVLALKAEGKIRHFGISFHDTADALDFILTSRPEIEVVQIQFNYLDYEDPWVQSKACYEVCRKHGKPIIVMEPIKGGQLINLPEDVSSLLGDRSPATFAIRYTQSFEGMFMTLSGMGNMDMMRQNVAAMKEFVPFDEEEHELANRLRAAIRAKNLIGCTACRYCTTVCPKDIAIPEIFNLVNKVAVFPKTNTDDAYEWAVGKHGRAGDCIDCGACEGICPQALPVRELISKAARQFEKKD